MALTRNAVDIDRVSAPTIASPINDSLTNLALNLEELESIILTLSERLQTVSNLQPTPNKVMQDAYEVTRELPHSEMVNRVIGYSTRVKNCVDSLRDILGKLEL